MDEKKKKNISTQIRCFKADCQSQITARSSINNSDQDQKVVSSLYFYLNVLLVV